MGTGVDAPGLCNNNVVEWLMLVAEACQPNSKDHGDGCDVFSDSRAFCDENQNSAKVRRFGR